MNNKYYKIVNNKIIGINNEVFNGYVLNNNYNAPPIPEKIVEIKNGTFDNALLFKQIYVPISFKEIDIFVYSKFKKLTINYANLYDIGITEKDPYKKSIRCFKLLKIHNIIFYNKFISKKNGIDSYIPEGVVFIGEYSFKNILNLNSIIFPKSTIAIYRQAFMNCYNLKKIKLSKECCDFGEESFKNCTSLRRIIIYKSMFSIRENVFKGCSNLIINIFETYDVNLDEFLLNEDLSNSKNLECTNRRSIDKVLITNNYLFILYNLKVYKIEKDSCVFDKKSNAFIKYSNDYCLNNIFRKYAFNLLFFIKKEIKLETAEKVYKDYCKLKQ